VFAESIKVYGHVQGVGFRAHVRRIANACGVDCSVWNASDGTVRIRVKHLDSEALYGCFCRQLAEGPGRADFLLFQGLEPEEAV
jgi:acylphosphatase